MHDTMTLVFLIKIDSWSIGKDTCIGIYWFDDHPNRVWSRDLTADQWRNITGR